jgi:hypothetical protein
MIWNKKSSPSEPNADSRWPARILFLSYTSPVLGLGLVTTHPEEEVIMAVLREEQEVSGWTRMGMQMKMISNLVEIGWLWIREWTWTWEWEWERGRVIVKQRRKERGLWAL